MEGILGFRGWWLVRCVRRRISPVAVRSLADSDTCRSVQVEPLEQGEVVGQHLSRQGVQYRGKLLRAGDRHSKPRGALVTVTESSVITISSAPPPARSLTSTSTLGRVLPGGTTAMTGKSSRAARPPSGFASPTVFRASPVRGALYLAYT
jgi:hypothetical protein